MSRKYRLDVAGTTIEVDLSARQHAILDALLAEPGAVVARHRLRQVAGVEQPCTDHAFTLRLRRLRGRLTEASAGRVQLITVYGAGVRLAITAWGGALTVGPLTLDVATRMATAGAAAVQLSPTDSALLQELMARPGEIVSLQDLQAACQSREPSVSDLWGHIGHLRRALRPLPAVEIQSAPGQGYRLSVEPPAPSLSRRWPTIARPGGRSYPRPGPPLRNGA